MRKRMLTILTIIIFVVLLIGIVLTSTLVKKYMPTDEEADLSEYFGNPTGEQMGVTVDDEVVGAQAVKIDGVAYINYETVRDYINGRFYWDANENVLLYTLPTDIVSASVGESDYYITNTKQSEDYTIVKAEGADTYIAAEFVQKYSNMEYVIYEEPNRMVVSVKDGELRTVQVKSSTQIREKGGIKSAILKEVDKKAPLTVIEEEDNWIKVRSTDGFIGYVQSKKVTEPSTVTVERKFEEEEFTNISKDYTINMAWHQVTTQDANNEIATILLDIKGLTTISPTWFALSDNDGNISSLASNQYVNYANNANIDVWGLVDNFTTEGIDTYEVLSYTSKRENLTNQLIGAAMQYGLDGINIDFEDITAETGEHYVQFIREMSVKCRNNGIVLSVDNYIPKTYNSHYNIAEQAIVADYVILMGYDEHHSGSLESGSVASIGFVKEGIEAALKSVPAEKLVNAVPFYSNLWKESAKSEDELAAQAGTEEGQHLNNVTIEKVFGMKGAASHAQEAQDSYGAQYSWDDETAQYYLEYERDGAIYKMWLEDETSIEEKLKVIKENNLAGVAEWKIGLERSSIWDVILKYIN